MSHSELDSFLRTLQQACLPGIWSKGVAAVRVGSVAIDVSSEEEIILRVKNQDRPVSAKVSLWPRDEDYFCDCESKADPCFHVAAAVVALKTGSATRPLEGVRGGTVEYHLSDQEGFLHFERRIGGEPLRGSLVAYVGGIESGRIGGTRVDATRDDFAVDHALGEDLASGRLSSAVWKRLLPVLRSIPTLSFEGRPVVIGSPLHRFRAVLNDAPSSDGSHAGLAFWLSCEEEPLLSSKGARVFKNGVCCIEGTLRILEEPALDAEWFDSKKGKRFSGPGITHLLESILPELEKRVPLEIRTKRLPVLAESPPRIEIRSEVLRDSEGEESLSVVPALVYESEYNRRDPVEERRLLRKLQEELQLVPGHRVIFRSEEAIAFVKKLEEWNVQGEGVERFIPESVLLPELSLDTEGLTATFRTPNGKRSSVSGVLAAWKSGASYVRLLEGGFAKLPEEWMARFASRLERLVAYSVVSDDPLGKIKLPAELRPESLRFMEESGFELSGKLKELKRIYEASEGVPVADLPSDLRAKLRPYQRAGVDWLCFHREAGTGALLADDMGLGKTLQAIASIRGRALIVCPTSVLHSWESQIHRFRPSLRLSVYHGSNRVLDSGADVILTTYGVLRLDSRPLLEERWGTIVLDEAQTIKNPDSQVAQAAHELGSSQGQAFRIALSGTPIENNLQDLWSQFRFLNPGLLRSREEFAAFDGHKNSEELRRLVKPFVLRRLKRDVATELPPKTEIVLNAEFTQHERELYEALLASSRKEIMERLEVAEGKGSLFSVLEQLLRLRQACCHPRLLPGEKAETSAKLELMESTLRDSVQQGHRVLVFSQWTSFLDLIEERVEHMGIRYCRLDGQTRDRSSVVDAFQKEGGPDAMLISLKAGGVGVTLTAADHVFLMDSWWNPAIEEQAADRAHRIGQENPVFVYRFIFRNSIEEKILELQSSKKELVRSIFSEESGLGEEEVQLGRSVLSREDILGLIL